MFDRRALLKAGGLTALASVLPGCSRSDSESAAPATVSQPPSDYTIRIGTGLVELAPDRIIATTLYNKQFPGPLIRLKEGRPVTVDLWNDTDTPEQLHWHGQTVPVEVDGSAEEGTPYIPAHGHRRITFTPGPSGLRFYHTHLIAGTDLRAGQYGGQVGPVYIEPAHDPGAYDREVFLTLKEFEPAFSRGGDMAMDFLAPGDADRTLRDQGESAMQASLAKGAPHGYEVGYQSFTINGRMLGHGEPVRVKAGERVLLHIINGSATEIRSLALPGHRFTIIALDGNPLAAPVDVPVLWLGTAERVSAIVEMRHLGVWVLGDTGDDRNNGMGIVIEYAGASGKPAWIRPPAFKWDYTRFGRQGWAPPDVDDTIERRSRRTMPRSTGSISGASTARHSRWRAGNRCSHSATAHGIGCACATPLTTSTLSISIARVSRSSPSPGVQQVVSSRTLRCSMAIRSWNSTSRHMLPAYRSSTAISRSTWTLVSWRSSTAAERIGDASLQREVRPGGQTYPATL